MQLIFGGHGSLLTQVDHIFCAVKSRRSDASPQATTIRTKKNQQKKAKPGNCMDRYAMFMVR